MKLGLSLEQRLAAYPPPWSELLKLALQAFRPCSADRGQGMGTRGVGYELACGTGWEKRAGHLKDVIGSVTVTIQKAIEQVDTLQRSTDERRSLNWTEKVKKKKAQHTHNQRMLRMMWCAVIERNREVEQGNKVSGRGIWDDKKRTNEKNEWEAPRKADDLDVGPEPKWYFGRYHTWELE